MKVLFVNPPRFNELLGNNPEIIETERGFNPPLGLLYIAGYLLKQAEHEVGIIDSQVERLDYDSLKERIRAFSPDIVGITAMTFTLLDVVRTVDVIKKINPGIKIVLGGPHPTIYPEETINLPGVDFVVVGEGERVFADLLDALGNKDALKAVKGIVFKDEGTIHNIGRAPFIEDLDSLPFPARQLTPYKQYTSLLAKDKTITTVFTSRGCPYNCTFCDRPALGKAFRKRSAKNVVDEIELCFGMGIKEFLVYDDTFTVDKERVTAICEEIIKRNLKIRWDIRARINTVDNYMLDKLKSAGCQGIHYGIESGVQRILELINKNITLDDARRVIRMTKAKKIKTLAYFMIGLPTETRDDIIKTLSFAKELAPDYLHVTVFTPFPSTRIYQDGLKDGTIKRDYWRDFAAFPQEGFTPPFWGANFTKDELSKMLVDSYKSFYLRPGYVAKRLLGVGSFRQLRKLGRAGFKVLKMRCS